MRNVVRSLGLALALAAVSVGTVTAHECVVVNRSDQGDLKAGTSSARWIALTLEGLYERTEMVGLPDLTPAQVTYAAELAASLGVPEQFTWRTDKTIAGDAAGFEKNGHGTDRAGVDHFFEIYGDQVVGAVFAALENA